MISKWANKQFGIHIGSTEIVQNFRNLCSNLCFIIWFHCTSSFKESDNRLIARSACMSANFHPSFLLPETKANINSSMFQQWLHLLFNSTLNTPLHIHLKNLGYTTEIMSSIKLTIFHIKSMKKNTFSPRVSILFWFQKWQSTFSKCIYCHGTSWDCLLIYKHKMLRKMLIHLTMSITHL